MSVFEYKSSLFGVTVMFDPEDGELVANFDDHFMTAFLPKGEAINLASKLLQWGTQK